MERTLSKYLRLCLKSLHSLSTFVKVLFIHLSSPNCHITSKKYRQMLDRRFKQCYYDDVYERRRMQTCVRTMKLDTVIDTERHPRNVIYGTLSREVVYH